MPCSCIPVSSILYFTTKSSCFSEYDRWWNYFPLSCKKKTGLFYLSIYNKIVGPQRLLSYQWRFWFDVSMLYSAPLEEKYQFRYREFSNFAFIPPTFFHVSLLSLRKFTKYFYLCSSKGNFLYMVSWRETDKCYDRI